MPYHHVVFTLPARIADIAYQNKAVIYDILFKGEPANAIGSREGANAETLLTIAADPRHLGARIGLTAVLHSWGSALTHHPHLHMIVPGGGISLARGEKGASPTGIERTQRWVSCRPRFLPRRCGCSRGRSGACSWRGSRRPTTPAA